MIVAAALQALARNKMRSALTMLGVFIGVAALIAMVAVGQGANDAVRKQIESLGTNLLVVVPGATTMGGMRSGQGSASTLTVVDAEALRREAPAVGSVSYLIRQSGQVQYANQNWTTNIQGVSANYPPTTNWQIMDGRGISREDVTSAALVVVLGQTVARQLFGTDKSPIGAVIQVKSTPLRVIGLFASKGQTAYGTDQDDLVMIPFTTAERSARRRGTKPAAGPAQLGLSANAQSLQSSATADGLCQPDLCPGDRCRRGSAGGQSGHRHPDAAPSDPA
jgi:macrolide transport system ATP-binding/permease protein